MYRTISIIGAVAALLLGLSATPVAAEVVQRHTATISASCDGVVIDATSYDANATNRFEVQIGNKIIEGDFGSSYSNTFAVPQGGATTSWSAMVEAEDGSYHFEDSGTVGPCGTPPEPEKKRASFNVVAYCNVVHVEGRHNVKRIIHTRFGARGHRFEAHAAKGAVFANGETVKVKRAWTKRSCGSGSS